MSEQQGGGGSFADLFEKEAAAQPAAVRVKVGDRVEGTVVQVTESYVFVELGSRLQGTFERLELEQAGVKVPVVGERIGGFVLAVESGGQLRLGRALGDTASLDQLVAARDARLPVEGKVSGVNRGGVSVTVGGVRAFCPMGQLDTRFVKDASVFLGQTLRFHVTEIKDKDVVLSRRSVLEEEASRVRDDLAARLAPGTVLDGRVTRVREFGAFVDLGGVEGLIPTRELSHDRRRPEEVASEGDAVKVQVLEVEKRDGELRISLSLKALAADPWDAIDAVAPVGRVVAGQVSRLADFGAFVRIAPGVEGLLHITHLPAPIAHPSERLHVGQQLLVEIESVDRAKKRIALALADEGAAVGAEVRRDRPVLGAVVKAEVVQIERYGVFVQIAGIKGREGRGLIPVAELGVGHGADLRKEFPLGTEVTAKILETGERRLRLSVKAAAEDAERADYDAYRQEQAGKSMGSFGDLLKQSLKKG